ncbi:MAG: hypothetical protein IJZ31_01035 [Bacteroidaceae bacterium]|nr:hypothetical protein [Bacteroidaceae bacterium]
MKIRISPIIVAIFRFSILFEILWGAHAWITWQCDASKFSRYLTLFILCLIAFIYKKDRGVILSKSKRVISALFLYCMGYWAVSRFSIGSLFGCFLTIYPMWVLLSDKHDPAEHLTFIVKILSMILVIGIVQYLFLQVVRIPGLLISYKDNLNYTFFNYGFCLLPLKTFGESFRFSSVFLEPGYMAAMLSFMLYAVKYDFSKRYNRILLYSLLLSFSLAGYLLFVVGYILYQSINGIKIVKYIGFALCLGLFYLVAINYNDGDNLINEKIVKRLQPDEKKGIVGNNRTSDVTERYFRNGFKNGNNLLGLGLARVKQINGGDSLEDGFSHDNINGTGYKYYIVVHGLVSALFFLFFYIKLGSFTYSNCRCRRYNIYLVVLVILTFIQASYPSSPSWIYPIILGLNGYKRIS